MHWPERIELSNSKEFGCSVFLAATAEGFEASGAFATSGVASDSCGFSWKLLAENVGDAFLPAAQQQGRHRKVEPRRLGALNAHDLDVAFGEFLEELRHTLLAGP